MSINLKSTGKMVAETLSLDQSTVNKNTCLKSTPNYSRKVTVLQINVEHDDC